MPPAMFSQPFSDYGLADFVAVSMSRSRCLAMRAPTHIATQSTLTHITFIPTTNTDTHKHRLILHL
jgi:hypothetical protein